MASACFNSTGMSPENFLDCPPSKYQAYGRLSPRASFSREVMDDTQSSKAFGAKHSSSPPRPVDKCGDDKQEDSDPEVLGNDAADFEFRLDRPEIMLPADELFSDGMLLPLQLPTIRLPATLAEAAGLEATLPDTPKIKTRNEISGSEPWLFSTKAPRCSSRWKELLGLKKLYQNRNVKDDSIKTTSPPPLSSSSQSNSSHKSMKIFLQRYSKSLNSSIDESLSFPLLKDSDNESASNSSRLSLSSSSSGHENDDLPRISLDSEKPVVNLSRNPPRVRLVKARALSSENPAGRVCRSPVQRAPDAATIGGVSADSPRMNSSGKIVFHSLERSSSSPSSLNGGEPRYKHRGMERSYSANVRVTRVLNVPVCSLRSSSKPGVFGFPLFSSSSSSQQKKEAAGSSNGGNGVGYKNHQGSSRHRIKK
ncbi:PREDICTED: uncharacterized protein LOC109190495 [Ipomoea nil]|uniref:uncharacterized protein LOC109190495 n=1 Tax=Ipomoea nil TaxID=35883 RepID=UPI000901B8F8|nr:PREDICTED: uncharacterized protein LOC109190495 [Ipomoea nil]XP_019196525.1 PREDICTED: uncharacterized protein LOC109190495 [Ipomoea nil]XP_019196526.1 PREDICTED: uncharacterized protein LOC109190495 [Ipomoea nil]